MSLENIIRKIQEKRPTAEHPILEEYAKFLDEVDKRNALITDEDEKKRLRKMADEVSEKVVQELKKIRTGGGSEAGFSSGIGGGDIRDSLGNPSIDLDNQG